MLKRALLANVALLCAVARIEAAGTHTGKGLVLETDPSHHTLTVSCEAIPGYMSAMEMEFTVRQPGVLAELKPGIAVSFTIVERNHLVYAEDIHTVTTANFESEPMAAGQLTALDSMLGNAPKELAVGEHVPDFALTDQVGKQVHLAQFEGKVVAITFGYSRCPNPNYCFRLSNNFAQARQLIHGQAGRDYVFLTIMIDPEHDQGATLAEYAAVWKADPSEWHFLTGPLPEIKQVAANFGMNFWRAEGSLTHSLRTILIDRKGQLAVNLQGNQFTPRELGDLLQTVINRP